MEAFIAWCGFLGAWLLVAGPLYQGAFELLEEQIDRDAFATATQLAPRSAPISPWWWLLPPVAIIKARRRARDNRTALIRALPPDQLSKLLGFMDKANGWLVVALGALLISIKETGELVTTSRWDEWAFPVLLVIMLLLTASFTVYRISGSQATHPSHTASSETSG